MTVFSRMAVLTVFAVLSLLLPPLPATGQGVAPERGNILKSLRGRCVRQLTTQGVYWGNPNDHRWNPEYAAWLCDIARPGTDPIRCFSTNLGQGMDWQQAIIACRTSSNRPAGTVDNRASWRLDPCSMPGARGGCRPQQSNPQPPRDGTTAQVPLPLPVRPPRPAPPLPPSVLAGHAALSLQNQTPYTVDYYSIGRSGQPLYAGTMRSGGNAAFNARPGTEFIFGVGGRQISAYRTGAETIQTFAVRHFDTLPFAGVANPPARPAPLPQPASATYDYVFSFTSPGNGIDGTTARALDQYLASQASRVSYQVAPWGREGERDYCVRINDTAAAQRNELHNELMAVVSGGRVRVEQNRPCSNL